MVIAQQGIALSFPATDKDLECAVSVYIDERVPDSSDEGMDDGMDHRSAYLGRATVQNEGAIE